MYSRKTVFTSRVDDVAGLGYSFAIPQDVQLKKCGVQSNAKIPMSAIGGML